MENSSNLSIHHIIKDDEKLNGSSSIKQQPLCDVHSVKSHLTLHKGKRELQRNAIAFTKQDIKELCTCYGSLDPHETEISLPL